MPSVFEAHIFQALVMAASLVAITAMVDVLTRRLPLPGSALLVLVGAALAFGPGATALLFGRGL